VDDAPGLNRTRIGRALSEGLIFTPLEQTVLDTYAWAQEQLRTAGRESLGAAGLAADKEAALLRAWTRRSG